MERSKMLILYSSGPACSRCHQIQQRLAASGITYMIADLTSPKIIAELRTEGIFSLEAPILHKRIAIGGISRDEWYLAGDLFQGDVMDENKLARILEA
jgi:hypothetical protein